MTPMQDGMGIAHAQGRQAGTNSSIEMILHSIRGVGLTERQSAPACCGRGADEDGCGSCQPQGTWAGHHQDVACQLQAQEQACRPGTACRGGKLGHSLHGHSRATSAASAPPLCIVPGHKLGYTIQARNFDVADSGMGSALSNNRQAD